MLKEITKGLLLLVLAGAAQAEIVTFGDLSTDQNYHIIADTEMGREYLRLDTFSLTYEQTVASTQVGGSYEGWSIADSSIAADFVSAAFAPSGTACSNKNELNYI